MSNKTELHKVFILSKFMVLSWADVFIAVLGFMCPIGPQFERACSRINIYKPMIFPLK